jgi:deazaflavin-dependent oxidoreductase (nitroreductase family)
MPSSSDESRETRPAPEGGTAATARTAPPGRKPPVAEPSAVQPTPPGNAPEAEPAPPGNHPPVAQPAPPRGVLRTLLRLPVWLYRWRLGFLLGHRFLLLVHTGRRSGLRRETVLEVVRYDRARSEAVVAAGWGRRTQWLHNVEAGLAVEVWIGRERFAPEYRTLEREEAQAILESYERGSGLPKPLVRAVLSRLLGWRYDGTRAARLRAADQLPLIGFRPRG